MEQKCENFVYYLRFQNSKLDNSDSNYNMATYRSLANNLCQLCSEVKVPKEVEDFLPVCLYYTARYAINKAELKTRIDYAARAVEASVRLGQKKYAFLSITLIAQLCDKDMVE